MQLKTCCNLVPKAKVKELEAELVALRTAKDAEVKWLQDAVSAGQTVLQEKSKDVEVIAELERHRALDTQHALERERQLVAEEK